MGSIGKTNSGPAMVNTATVTGNEKYTDFGNGNGAEKWFANTDLSNYTSWHTNLLTSGEKQSIVKYTGTSYVKMNQLLYTQNWDTIDAKDKTMLSNMYNGISKFELKKGINVTRQCDFQIFGVKGLMTPDAVKQLLTSSGGVIQNNGFLSFSADNRGRSIAGSGLIIHLRIPPSTGAGAYVKAISQHGSENEFILNNNSVLRFDPQSVTQDGYGKIHVNADWLGQAKSQVFAK